MKPFTFKQRIVCMFINILEIIINSSYLVSFLNYFSKAFHSIMLSKDKLYSGSSSLFRGLSIAFITDGNRRWIKLRKSKLIKEGKSNEYIEEYKVRVGIKKIEEIVKFAYFHQLKEVSFYCFAIKNFNRPKVEVNGIMNYIKKHGIMEQEVPFRFKLYGKLDLLDKEVKKTFLDLEELTKRNSGFNFNIFFGYSSSDDDRNLNRFNNKVDLLVRTSGEKRLSDFMVRNVASGTGVEFIEPFWPDLSLAHFWLILFKFLLEEKYLRN